MDRWEFSFAGRPLESLLYTEESVIRTRNHLHGRSPKPIYRRISSGLTRAAANSCNQLNIPKGIRLQLPSLLNLDKFLQCKCLSKEDHPLRVTGITREGGMKTSTHLPMRPYEGDQMQDYE